MDRLVVGVLVAEFIIVVTSLSSVFLYDTWLGAMGFVLGFTLLICALPVIVALESRAKSREIGAPEAPQKAAA